MTLARAAGDSRAAVLPARPAGRTGQGAAGRVPGRIGRWTLGVWLAALAVLLLSSRGQIFFDTKLGVVIDPAGFYARLWHPWNPDEWFGALQDQYIGYAFPMAPFYLALELLRVPVWVTERLWLALLIAVGFAGLVKLAETLGIGTPRSRIVAGLAFALWPTFTIVIGSTSAGVLPGLLAPWAVVPLAAASQTGSLTRAAARSGAAVLCMGGVNATSTLDALLLPGLYIVTSLSGARRVKLAALWAGAVVAATAWWAGPLLVQARYSFNFLPYVEQSSTTSATMSAATFLRGAGNWTAYLNLGQPWLRAGWVMVAFTVAILAAAAAAATGLLGLARRDLPAGTWLRLTLAVAALVALAGYPGPLGGPLHQPVDHLLNGALAPLRNVYKVEPATAAVLALGIAHAVILRTRRAAIAADPAPRVLWHAIAAAAIALVLLGLAYPQVSGQLLNAGSFRAVPRYWYAAAAYLRAHSPRDTALVVPAESHGTFLWGEPVDDPLEPLASSPWAAQSLVPFGGAGSAVLLRSLESALTSGQRVPGLAGTLRRSGIRYVVVRNDLSPAALDYTAPQVVHQTLAASGFRRVASFGPLITGAQTDPGSPQIQYALPSYPAVEVFVAGRSGTRPPPAAVALPVSATVLVNGGPDALLQLTAQHVLRASAPAVIAGDRLAAPPAAWAVTDSNRRSDHLFGLLDATGSYTYTATGTNPPADPLGDAGGPPRQIVPVSGTSRQTVAVIAGAVSVTASSSGSWLAETPQIDPVNVFDGNPATVWTEADPSTPVGQWVQITFSHPVVLPDSVGVSLLDDLPARPVPSRLTVSTDTGTMTSAVRRTALAQPLQVPPGPTRTLRITIAGVTGGAAGGLGAGLAGVSIPGVKVTRFLKVPQDTAGEQAGVLAFSFERQVPSPASLANVAGYPPMARTFATSGPGEFTFRARAIAVPGSALDAVLASLTPVRRNSLEVTASSTWGSLPGLAAANLFRAAHPGSWVAGASRPVIRLAWKSERTIRRMVLRPLPGFAAAPEAIKITSPQGTRYAQIGLDGLTEIVPPLTTTRMNISFPVVQYTTTFQPVSGQVVPLPVGLSQLSVPALAGLHPAALAPGKRFSLPCGSGPRITADGRTLPTEVFGRVGALIGFQPVRVRLCGSQDLAVTAGRHWLTASRPGAFTLTGLSLVAGRTVAAGGAAAPSAAGVRRVRVRYWTQERRTVLIGPGTRSYLELHQNFNAGWTASLDGHRLAPARLDGWQQAFVVPAGQGGVVTLTFRPVKFYHVWIIIAAVAALVLAAAAAGRRRRREAGEQMDDAIPAAIAAPAGPLALPAQPAAAQAADAASPAHASTGPASTSAASTSPASIGLASAGPASTGPASTGPASTGPASTGTGSTGTGSTGTGSTGTASGGLAGERHAGGAGGGGVPASAAEGRLSWAWLCLLALAVLIGLIGGPAALAVPALAVVAYRRPGWLGVIAAGAMVAAGVLTAMAPHPAQPGTGAFGAPAQACALIALTAALMPVLARRPGRAAGAP